MKFLKWLPVPPLGGTGMYLSFATMSVQSSDYFWDFASEGVELFDGNGAPVSGDLTERLAPYDTGTEVDEEPGVGLNQKPRQTPNELDKGSEEGGTVQLIVSAGEGSDTKGSFSYLGAAQVIRITITSQIQDQ